MAHWPFENKSFPLENWEIRKTRKSGIFGKFGKFGKSKHFWESRKFGKSQEFGKLEKSRSFVFSGGGKSGTFEKTNKTM